MKKGIEYRTPSNSWCSFDEETMEELFIWIERGVKFLEKRHTSLLDKYLEKTIFAILNADVNIAKEIINEIEKK